MSYAVRLPNRQNLMVPAVALALGFAGATGAYVALDDGFLTDDSSSSTPAAAVSNANTGVNESSTAAAVGAAQPQQSTGASESSTAAAVGGVQVHRIGGANEASTAAAVGRSSDTARFLADRGIVLRRSAPPSPGGSRP